MGQSYPPDSFDAVREDAPRVGAHRGAKSRGRVWRALSVAAVGVVLLTAAGWLVVQQTRSGTGPVAGPLTADGAGSFQPWDPPEAAPERDPDATVTVLNGTTQTGLAAAVGEELVADGWNVVTESSASDTDIEQTVVYYGHLGSEGAARALAEDLGGVQVQLATYYLYGSELTVVVGKDRTT
ncbi:MAG: LytR C-terminal domain-containing protein [Microbacterium sp.]|nr:LytR C-terminal domain-containing protein [Microbacterium sp.]